MEEVTSQMRLCQQLLTAFAALGVLLAGVGIYGAMARMVAQRTNEIGLRLALGAQVSSVVALVFGSGVRIVGLGAGAGMVGAFGLSRLLASALPTMRTDGTLVGVAGAGLLVAIGCGRVLRPSPPSYTSEPDRSATGGLSSNASNGRSPTIATLHLYVPLRAR